MTIFKQGNAMLIGIPKESLQGETRVAATPDTVGKLLKLGFEVAVQSNAGALASFDDSAYEKAGAKIGNEKDVWAADIIFKLNAPTDAEIELMHEGQTLVSFIRPAQNKDLVDKLNAKKVTVMAMDMVPRISRAQSLDALSSTANISGYRAVIEAAHAFGRFFTGQVTAAGKVPPAKVMVIGAGVAGLAAIGTAHSLGAIVRAFDTRLEVADQIRSMGGDSAFEEALFLTRFGSSVTLIHRRDSFRASQIMVDRAKANPTITLMTNTVVTSITGTSSPTQNTGAPIAIPGLTLKRPAVAPASVSSIAVRNMVTGEESTLDTNAVFVAIGHTPATDFAAGVVDRDDDGYVVVQGASTVTSAPGIFAAGDCVDRTYRQAISAAGMGCRAALDTQAYLTD